MLTALLLPVALAGDTALYQRTLDLLDQHYLKPELLDRSAMFREAGQQLESRVEWLLVDQVGGTLQLRDGAGGWKAEVTLASEAELPAALARLEDAVRAANLPIDAGTDPRVEILKGMVRGLDRHSVVLFASGLERFDERLSGAISGVGATIGREDDALVVKALLPGGPAERAGVRAGDRVMRIDGVSTVGMDTSDATDRIRGLAGTDVTLLFDRGGAPVTLTIQREEITIQNVEVARGPHDVGVLTIEHFSEQTDAWLADGLERLAEMGVLQNGLVIDLRGNTGGSLVQSAQAADTFLQSGLIVSTVGRDGQPVSGLIARLDAQPSNPPYAMPIAVLMDHDTASGSEIVAGALARLDRALLVGANSFGKGTVQKVYQLGENLKLKLTVAEYLVEGTQRVVDVGLQPDVELEGVHFGETGAWYPAADRERRLLPPGTPALRHLDGDDRETPLRVAAAIVAAADGGGREDMLDAAGTLLADLEAEEDTRLVAAFRAEGIDWRAGRSATTPVVDLDLSFTAPPTSGQTTELRASLVNRGGDLYRAAIRLRSDNPLWDDRVLPVGWVPAGQTVTGRVRVSPSWGLPSRTDSVVATLEADGISPRALETRRIDLVGVAPPPFSVVARARTDAKGRVRVSLDLGNRGPRTLTDVRARFDFPDADGIELSEASTPRVAIAGRDTRRVQLGLQLASRFFEGGRADPIPPLTLLVESDAFGRLGSYTLTLPREGGSVRLEAPVVTVGGAPGILPPGTATLHVRAADDHALDHVVVFGGSERMDRTRWDPVVDHRRDKLAWRPGEGKRTDFDLVVPVAPGTNHYLVIAEDRTGLRTQTDVYILGDDGGTEAISAKVD